MSMRILLGMVPLFLLFFGCGINDPFGAPFSTGKLPGPIPVTVADIDGNIYHTVKIGFREWTVENLKATRYNDGTAIPLVTDSAAWATLTTPGYCWYNNDTANKDVYGALYNWQAVNTGKLAPAGWHVANDADWGSIAEVGAITNIGFAPLLGGLRSSDGPFFKMDSSGYWWTSTLYGVDTTRALSRVLGAGGTSAGTVNFPRGMGFSVRCVRYY